MLLRMVSFLHERAHHAQLTRCLKQVPPTWSDAAAKPIYG
jgi:hypothetical protein